MNKELNGEMKAPEPTQLFNLLYISRNNRLIEVIEWNKPFALLMYIKKQKLATGNYNLGILTTKKIDMAPTQYNDLGSTTTGYPDVYFKPIKKEPDYKATVYYNRYVYSKLVWPSADGDIIIQAMDSSHIKNCIARLEKRIGDLNPKDKAFLEIFKEELGWREKEIIFHDCMEPMF